MLVAVDIQNKEFKKAKFGGYNVFEVNEFLDEVLETYQEITKENYELKDKINMLNENLQYYRTMEATIQNALVLAEKTAQDTKALAYEKSDQIKKEAEQKADLIIENAKQEVYTISHRTEELKKQYLSFKVQMRQILQGQLEIIEQQNITILAEDFSSMTLETEQSTFEKEIAVTTDDETFYTKEFTVLEDIQK
ncbi:MAG: DivIVA domain-containing protein [Cellulosilyticaceae bacterium]